MNIKVEAQSTMEFSPNEEQQLQNLDDVDYWAAGLTALQEQAAAVMETLRRDTNRAVLDIVRQRARHKRL